MQPSQAVGWLLLNTSAVTAYTSTRVYHGTRPESSAASSLPAINFYELPGARANGIEPGSFSISCRAVTADTAMGLARAVTDLFSGTSGTGMWGTSGTAGNAFSVARSSVRNQMGLIPEPESNCYNAPVDVLIVYPLDTVS